MFLRKTALLPSIHAITTHHKNQRPIFNTGQPTADETQAAHGCATALQPWAIVMPKPSFTPGGQFNDHTTSPALCVFYADAAAAAVDNLLGKGQSKTIALLFMGAVTLIEFVEYTLFFFIRDAMSLIFHSENKPTVGLF